MTSKIAGLLPIILAGFLVQARPALAKLSFNFSFADGNNDPPGTVFGRIDGLVDDRENQPAARVTINGTTAALDNLPSFPLVITAPAFTISNNRFTVLGGQLTNFTFTATGILQDNNTTTFELRNPGLRNRTSLTFGGNTTIRDFDSSTVKVQAVPEPLTILGSAAALGFGFLLAREYGKI